MKIWVDVQLSPLIAQWLSSTYGMEAVAVRDLRLRDARDRDIFLSAREAKAIILTKDSDMADLVTQLGAPPSRSWGRGVLAPKFSVLLPLSFALQTGCQARCAPERNVNRLCSFFQ